MNVNNMSPTPPNLEEKKRETEGERGKVSETKMTGEQFS